MVADDEKCFNIHACRQAAHAGEEGDLLEQKKSLQEAVCECLKVSAYDWAGILATQLLCTLLIRALLHATTATSRACCSIASCD
jgi:hypothetical protein